MGALTLRSLQNFPDNFAVSTTDVIDQPDGTVSKKSKVEVFAVQTQTSTDVWIALKVRTPQSVRLLKVGGSAWIGPLSFQDRRGVREVRRLFKPAKGEKWTAYRVKREKIPFGRKFSTELRIRPRVVKYPDAQVVTILVCYIPARGSPLKREAVLVGHSQIPTPRPKRARARKTKSRP